MAAATTKQESAATLRGRVPWEHWGPPGSEARQKQRLRSSWRGAREFQSTGLGRRRLVCLGGQRRASSAAGESGEAEQAGAASGADCDSAARKNGAVSTQVEPGRQ
ncbi:hypothetical protein NDU88_001188 [Pleurodeles waltl]|uniref:Uncharacterized protein n=1 Tax=Pleurodeles waltl TaxID=8319 RepID=A0AAV7WK47_PLEWA|nr:hypothetical protein NDU88_001188 [Pleurodeles waltl]